MYVRRLRINLVIHVRHVENVVTMLVTVFHFFDDYDNSNNNKHLYSENVKAYNSLSTIKQKY